MWFQRTAEAGQCVAGLESCKGALTQLQVPGQTSLYSEFQATLNEAISKAQKNKNAEDSNV